MVMEFCDGKLLRKIMDEGPLPPDCTIRISTGVLEAVQYLHDNGVVHRALSPERIMVDEHDKIKVIGLARPPTPQRGG